MYKFAEKIFHMRKSTFNLFNISTLLLFIVLLSSCRGDLPKYYFIVDGEDYELNKGYIINNGEVDGGFDIDLQLTSSDGTNFVSFGIVSKQAESVTSKTYSKYDGMWVTGYKSSGNYGNMAKISSGSLVIDRKSDGYTIELEGKDQYGNEVEIYFKGNLSITDKNNVVHIIPDYVIPEEIYDDVEKYFPIHSGINIPNIGGQYVSSPHILVYQSDSNNPDSVIFYSDRYVGFNGSNGQMNFYGKQYDPEQDKDIEEIFYNVKITGDNGLFTCYYVVDGYPNGYYAQQSFLYSGRKTDEGLEDFHTAVILLETSGHPNLPPKNTFRVLKDQDGIAYSNNWLSKSPSQKRGSSCSDEDLFKMWMK